MVTKESGSHKRRFLLLRFAGSCISWSVKKIAKKSCRYYRVGSRRHYPAVKRDKCHDAIPAVAALTAATAAAHESASTATVSEPAPVSTANTTTVPVRTDIGADALSPSSVQPADTASSASSGGSTSPAKPAAQVQPSFDCAKAAAVVEKLICSTPGLATADAELATFYKKNIVASGSDGGVN